MTSGQFKSFPVSSITVNPDRQREDVGDISDLAESIRRSGLIHPVVVTAEGVLVAGERRLNAIRALGWTNIPVQFTDDLSDIDLHVIELEENIRRKNLTWQEEAAAVAKYHELRVQQEGGDQTLTETAKELGVTHSSVSQKIAVMKEIARGNDQIKTADKFSTALNIATREQSRRASAVKSEIKGEQAFVPKVPLICDNFITWSAAYTGQPFNFIHCDFPYGVNMHKSGQGANQEFGSYADGKDVYFELLDALASSMDNVVADSAHLIFWFSMDYYDVTKSTLSLMGWRVNPFPLIWHKSDNTGIIPDAKRGPRRVYETAFFASRGDRLLTGGGATSNLYSCPGRGKEIHMNEKPVEMLQHFMSMFVDEYSFVLDPTCGSGNAIKAAQALGAGKVLGIEKDEGFYQRSVDMYFKPDEV